MLLVRAQFAGNGGRWPPTMSCGASCSPTGGGRTPRRSTRRRAPSPGRTSSSCRTDATDTDCKPTRPSVPTTSDVANCHQQLVLLRRPASPLFDARVCVWLRVWPCHVLLRGVRIIREGKDYYLIYQGEIQRYLGSRQDTDGDGGKDAQDDGQRLISNRILFFLGDLEAACADAKRVKAWTCYPVRRRPLSRSASLPVCMMHSSCIVLS